MWRLRRTFNCPQPQDLCYFQTSHRAELSGHITLSEWIPLGILMFQFLLVSFSEKERNHPVT